MTPGRAVRLVLTHRARALIPEWMRGGWWPPVPGGARRWALAPAWVNNGLVPAAAAVIAAVVAWRLGRQGLELVLIGAAAMIAARLVPVVRPERARDRHVAGRADHPELHTIVDEVAAELGVRRPSRASFAPVAEAGATRLGPRRTELWIGVPYLMGFDRAELRAVIAFELALLEARRPWLLGALVELWTAGTRMKPAVREELAAVVRPLIAEGDKAGCRVSDPETMACALLRGALMSASFDWFVNRYAVELPCHLYFPLDLYQAWRWKVYQDDLLARLMPRYLELCAADPDGYGSMTGRIAGLGVAVGRPPAPARDPILSTPGLVVEARFARGHLREALSHAPAMRRELTFPEVPETVWDELMKCRHDRILQAAAALLGRASATLDDVVGIVAAGRAAEITGEHRQSVCPHPSAGVCVLFPVLHRALRLRGYRYGQALRQRELVGPGGDRVDVVRLARAVEQGEGLPGALGPADGH